MDRIKVEVAYASPNKQVVIELELSVDASVREAINQAGVLADFPEIDLAVNKVGIFGKLVTLDTILHDADRVEIYRPLVCEPKERRRRHASEKSRT